MTSCIEDNVRKDNEIVEVSGELVDKPVKEEEIPQKAIVVPRPPP